MKAQTIAVAVAALAAGAALGYFLKPAPEAPAAAEPTPAPAERRVDDTELKALRQQVKALQARLAAAEAEKPAATEEKVEEPRPERGPRGGDWRARLEQWKKDNPEEFARIEKERQAFMQRRAERAKSRLEFLASIDTSKMSAADRETHEKLQGLLAKREALEAKMGQLLELSDEERNQLFADMRETHHEIHELNGQEREILFKQTAELLGFQGEEAGEISATITEIINATDNGFGGPGGPGGPGGRGPGGGRGGRGGR
ncbi:MAG: hypothetical protein IIY62_03990 [Kiritimatiellae bacterium]|nr:hypothetical protein [Kiritimatiellia bacterium]